MIFKEGKRIQKFPVTVLFRANETESNRFLYCTDRSVKKAVSRNRVKRTLRAVVHEMQNDIPQGFDIALIGGENFSKLNITDRMKKLKNLLLKMKNE